MLPLLKIRFFGKKKFNEVPQNFPSKKNKILFGYEKLSENFFKIVIDKKICHNKNLS